MVCAAIGQAIGSLVGRHLRQALLVVLGPLRLFDNVGGGVLGAVTGPRALLGRRRRAPLSPATDRAAPLRPGLGDPLEAQRGAAAAPPDRHARADRPVHHARRPGGGRRRARPGRARLGRRQRARRSASCASSATPAGSASKARAGSRATASSSRTRTSSPASTRRTSTATTAPLLDAQVVSFDKVNDIAVLRVAGLMARAAPLADATPGTRRRPARLPGQRPVHRDRRPRRPHRADRRPRRVRQLPGQPPGDDDPRRRSAAATRAGPSSMREGRVITTVFAQRVGTDGGYGVPNDIVRAATRAGRERSRSRRPAPTAERMISRAAGRARPRAA